MLEVFFCVEIDQNMFRLPRSCQSEFELRKRVTKYYTTVKGYSSTINGYIYLILPPLNSMTVYIYIHTRITILGLLVAELYAILVLGGGHL